MEIQGHNLMVLIDGVEVGALSGDAFQQVTLKEHGRTFTFERLWEPEPEVRIEAIISRDNGKCKFILDKDTFIEIDDNELVKDLKSGDKVYVKLYFDWG